MTTDVHGDPLDLDVVDANSDHASATLRSTNQRRVSSSLAAGRDRAETAQYDALLMQLYGRAESQADGSLLVGVTSCTRKCGTSLFTANLAARAAAQGMGPVLLIDANVQHPCMASRFRLPERPGLVEWLQEQAVLAEAVYKSAIPGLHLMPLGDPKNVGGLVEWERTAQALRSLRGEYALTLLDLPCCDALGSSALVARKADAVIVVVDSERVRRRDAASAVRQFRNDGLNVFGCVVTRQRRYLPRWLDKLL